MNLTPWRKKKDETGSNELAFTRGSDLFGGMDRWFEDFFNAPFARFDTWTPSMDVHESDDAFTVRAEVPGVDAKDLEVSVTDNVLTLSGEKKLKKESKENDVFRSERFTGTFQRSLALPEGVDAGKVAAELAHGVLTLTIPKAETAKPKRIDVKVK